MCSICLESVRYRLALPVHSFLINRRERRIEVTVVEVKMIIRCRFVWKSLYPLCRPVICNCIVFLLSSQQQEQDPTNLYIANLPLNFKENDVEALLAQYGQVISTRILRDTSGQSKGVGFARFAQKSMIVSLLTSYKPGYVCPVRDFVSSRENNKKLRIIYIVAVLFYFTM